MPHIREKSTSEGRAEPDARQKPEACTGPGAAVPSRRPRHAKDVQKLNGTSTHTRTILVDMAPTMVNRAGDQDNIDTSAKKGQGRARATPLTTSTTASHSPPSLRPTTAWGDWTQGRLQRVNDR